MTEPEKSAPIGHTTLMQANPTFINSNTTLPGAEQIELISSTGRLIGAMLGRIIARGLPCTVESPHGSGMGCGRAEGTLLIRYPMRGLNLPGERLVGQTQFCPECGPGLPRFVAPTPAEIADGWAPGTVS